MSAPTWTKKDERRWRELTIRRLDWIMRRRSIPHLFDVPAEIAEGLDKPKGKRRGA